MGGEFCVAYEIPSRYFMIITCHCLDMSQENYPRDLPHTFASVMCMCNSRPCVYYYLPPEAVVLSVYLLMLHIHPAEVDNISPYLLAPKDHSHLFPRFAVCNATLSNESISLFCSGYTNKPKGALNGKNEIMTNFFWIS